MIQNFSRALWIGFISVKWNSLEKGCYWFQRLHLALSKNHR